MGAVLLAKFTQNPELGKALVATGDSLLEEGNTWGDTFWGVCPPGSGTGHNWLGCLLMHTRSQIQYQHLQTL
jgi:predicted NAD-dependent protein-ADP-ribosyltransferase YbiA (DUF1768 family)